MVRGVSQINIRTGTRSRNLKSLLPVIYMSGITDKGNGCIGGFGIVQDTFRDIVKGIVAPVIQVPSGSNGQLVCCNGVSLDISAKNTCRKLKGIIFAIYICI